ncbi:ferritin-like domain-containing protein [Daejeonella sp. H1SJ63]|uniref:ferritin-like domain-containing protein n=1 Tax=Daejeonella sp. H1SJ63 TaxID=3034145 RepID=UPI0023EAC061|nr:ferritin-like domain-containing protein [Daejeonella sp. H1SJ63]
MNLLNILEEIEKTDAEVYERISPRRKAMSDFYGFSKKVALASLPFALGSIFKKAYAQNSAADVEGVLQFALTLEYLEAEFYTKGVAAAGLIPSGAALGAITAIRDHENQHVAFLKTALMSMGKTPVNKPVFDFSAGNGSNTGPFANVFSDYDTFLAVAQTFEDTGVRAYKGQAPALIGSGGVLTAALNIHSVEARHAAHIRQMRKARGANVKPWITGKDTGIGAAVQASYDGEELETQAGIKITGINGQTISMSAATEAFDEPLTKAQILAIVDPFIV